MRSYKDIAAAEKVLETIDDSRDGINLLIKTSLNVNSSHKLPNFDFKSTEMKTPKTVTKPFSFKSALLSSVEEKTEVSPGVLAVKALKGMKNRDAGKRIVAPLTLEEEQMPISLNVDENKLNNNLAVEGDFDMVMEEEHANLHEEQEIIAPQVQQGQSVNISKVMKSEMKEKEHHKPKVVKNVKSLKTDKLAKKFDFTQFVEIGNWASETEDSCTGMGSNLTTTLNFDSCLGPSTSNAAGSKLSITNDAQSLLKALSRSGASKLISLEEKVVELEHSSVSILGEAKRKIDELSNDGFESPETPVQKRVPEEESPVMQELTDERLLKREEQIKIGKQTVGYANYRRFHPKEEHERFEAPRSPSKADNEDSNLSAYHLTKTEAKSDFTQHIFPSTPRKTVQVSKRQWDVIVKRWRRSLHLYDNIDTQERFDEFVNSRQTEQIKSRTEDFKQKVKSGRKNEPKRQCLIATPAHMRARTRGLGTSGL